MEPDASRSRRIKVLLFIDTVFFFLELIVGYSVGSLALVADSFHMLNDVCSLLVALYAIKLAKGSKKTREYSYGWQRAEVLGALINGVFLIALCFSIFIEAIQRAFKPIDISSPRLIVLVGSLGLASNIVGLLMFHEHGHSHGAGHSHSHSHSHTHSHPLSHRLPTSSAPNDDVPPAHRSNNQNSQTSSAHERTPLMIATSASPPSLSLQPSSNSIPSYDSTSSDTTAPNPGQLQSSIDEICVHPAQARNNILRAAELQRDQLTHHRRLSKPDATAHPHDFLQSTTDPEALHSHQHNHSHSNMNMHAIFLHALGDALGNVGVIVTGLLIWVAPRMPGPDNSLRDPWVSFVDPALSLIITGIIFTSALPLVRSASLILLQGTPPHVDLGRVEKSILAIKGVLQVHELHIWSLSELKPVASVHVLIPNHDEFATISRQIRKCLHHYGIHSSTIQPEVLLEEQANNLRAKSLIASAPSSTPPSPLCTSTDLPTLVDADGCLAQCDENCDQEACCPPGSLLPMAS